MSPTTVPARRRTRSGMRRRRSADGLGHSVVARVPSRCGFGRLVPVAASLADLWSARALREPDAIAVDDGTTRLTWSEALGRAQGAAARLAEHGVAAGDVVVLQGRNTVEWVVVAAATHLLGATLAPLGQEETAAERASYGRRVGARVVIAEAPGAGELPISMEQPPHLGAATPAPRGAGGPAVVLATSGTAGHRTAVPMDHDVLLRLYADVADVLDIDHRDRLLGVVPLAHSFGFNGLLVIALLTGASLRLVPDRSRAALPGIVRESGVSVVCGPPTLLHDLAAAVREGADLGPRVRLFMTGATEIRPEVLLPLARETGIPRVSAGYGLTQTCGTVAVCPDIARTGVGGHAPMVPVPGVEVRILDDAGAPVPTGVPGRVVTRGYQVAVAVADPEGWFVTGDEGHLHDDGRLCVTGRLDDQLVVSGFNVDPARVEIALEHSPLVARAAVVGLPDPRRGHRLAAVVVPAAGAARDDAAVLAAARAALARYEVPDVLVWADDLPHTATGKLSRASVRALLAEQLNPEDPEHPDPPEESDR